jgi:hypothetical protein
MIPTHLEKMIFEGKARMKTFSCALAEQVVLTIPDKTYIIIYEYWYRPQLQILGGTTFTGTATWDWRDALQYVNFYSNNNYYAYWHSFFPDFQRKSSTDFPTTNPALNNNYFLPQNGLDFTQYRNTYIRSDRDLSIYFTRQNADNVSITNATVPNFEPVTSPLGYAGEQIMINGFAYHSGTGGAVVYAPLSNKLGPSITTAAQGWDNSMNCNPLNAGTGGEIESASNYTASLIALGKARAQHFQCNYVEVNMENPQNLST